MIFFQIFLLMLLALYIVGYVVTFALFLLGARNNNESNPVRRAMFYGLFSWFGVAAFLVAVAEGIDEINGIKK